MVTCENEQSRVQIQASPAGGSLETMRLEMGAGVGSVTGGGHMQPRMVRKRGHRSHRGAPAPAPGFGLCPE